MAELQHQVENLPEGAFGKRNKVPANPRSIAEGSICGNKQKIDKQQKGEKITATWLNRCKPMYYVCRILRGLGLGRWEGRHFPMQFRVKISK